MAEQAPVGFDRLGPEIAGLPVCLSSPHSGKAVIEGFLDAIAIPPPLLLALGDGPLHTLYAGILAEGVAMFAARFSRAVVDLNRAEDELAPELLKRPQNHRFRVTDKVRAGLGVIPSRIAGRAIYRQPLACADIRWRIEAVHRPFHAAVEAELAELVQRFGHALLLDCHSMPSDLVRKGGRPVDIVIGDAYGTSAAGELSELARDCFVEAGFVVQVNQPYAGAHVTRRHGRPKDGRSALQIEVQRTLFMNEQNHELHEDGEHVSRAMRDLVRRAGRLIIDRSGSGVAA